MFPPKLTLFLSTPSARRATACFPPRPRKQGEFLSTPSARRATLVFLHVHANRENFYPRPPRGGRPRSSQSLRGVRISIHALREEGDLPEKTGKQYALFLSTPSARGRHKVAPHVFLAVHISIHALREEATQKVAELTKRYNIFIHALREEGDHGDLCYIMPHDNFYPRPPRGGRRCLTA